MRNLFYPVLASFLILATPSLGQTWEVYDFSGGLQTSADFQDIDLIGQSVSVGKNASGLFLLSPDLRPVVDLQGQEVVQYLKPWILVKGPKGIGAFHEYGQLALPLEYEEILTYTNRLLARKGNEYWVFEKSTGKVKWLGTAEDAKLTRNGQVILKNQGQFFLPLSSTPDKAYELLIENQSNFLLAKEASGYGLIDLSGSYVLNPVLDQLEYTRGDNYFGYDENQYLLIRGFEERAQVRYNSYHKITKEGDLLLEYIHGKLRRVLEEEGILLDAVGMESVKLIGPDAFNIKFRENKLGLHGKNGWLVAPNSDAEWIGVGTEGLFPALKNGKYGFLDAAGKWIIAPSLPNGELAYPEGLDKIERLKEGYYLVSNNTKSGLLNSQGKQILPITFDQIQVENKDFFIVSQEGLSGVMKASGAVFLPLQYTEIAIDWNEQKVLAKSLPVPVAEENPETSPVKAPLLKRKKGA